MDPVFEAVLSGAVDFAVWRVKKFQLDPVISSELGKFYSGDCYLIFSKLAKREEIFYWIGRDASIDERTTVAIKAVELDTQFGGVPVQHREKEGYESQEFKKLFPEGFLTLTGGHQSGLKSTQTEHQTRLFKVSGGNIPMLSEVDVAWHSMNHGDTFVLDTGDFIFVWKGSQSSGAEGLAAAKLATRLRNRVGEEIIVVDDGQEAELTEAEAEAWNNSLPLQNKHEVRAADKSSDRKTSRVLTEVKLYRVSEKAGELIMELEKTGNLSRNDLDGGDSFVVEAGSQHGVWIWLGTKSSKTERSGAMEAGERLLTMENLPSHTRLTRVNMHNESEEFKSLFVLWN